VKDLTKSISRMLKNQRVKVLKVTSTLFTYFGRVVYLARSNAPIRLYLMLTIGMVLEYISLKRYRREREEFQITKSRLELTSDWFSQNLPLLIDLIERKKLREEKLNVLEIGSYEGLSTVFFLTSLRSATVHCVDTWQGSDEHKNTLEEENSFNEIECRFDSNLNAYLPRLKKFKQSSFQFFSNLKLDKFDIIYIDGSHFVDDVLIDAICAFKHLESGGYLIFDDCFWNYYPKPTQNPAYAINLFLRLKKCRIISFSSQLIVQK